MTLAYQVTFKPLDFCWLLLKPGQTLNIKYCVLGLLGLPGSKGDQGITGNYGTCGKNGRQGDPGPPGTNAFLQTHCLKSMQFILEDNTQVYISFLGQPGDPGIRGLPGNPGIDGNCGNPGITGFPGRFMCTPINKCLELNSFITAVMRSYHFTY